MVAEREQNEIDQSLDYIEQQQKEFETTLDVYEKSSEEILGSGGGLRVLDTGPADAERDKKWVPCLLIPLVFFPNLNSPAICLQAISTPIWTTCPLRSLR
jgi:hypothetical protein